MNILLDMRVFHVRGLIVIDEVQRRPDLFPVLRVLADRRNLPSRFLILGSASGDLLRQTSESLAGRMENITISGFSMAEPARALGVNESTTRRHLDLLTDAFMVRQLQPFHANLRKRQVKAPKIYLRDSGLLHNLLGIDSFKALLTHPKVGASWGGFVIEQVLATERYDEVFFWATHQGAEIDLILRQGDKLLGVECKRSDSPRMTPSIRHALADLGLPQVAVIYSGEKRFPLDKQVVAVPLCSLADGESLFAKN